MFSVRFQFILEALSCFKKNGVEGEVMDSRFTWCVDNVPIEGKSNETTRWVGNLHIEENSIVLQFLCKLKRFTHVSSDFEVLLINHLHLIE